MDWLGILKLVIVALTTLISTGIPFVISIVKVVKARKNAEEEAVIAKALTDMRDQALIFIQEAEDVYRTFDKLMKSQTGTSAGSVKKENVITKLQAYALSKGYDFNSEFWNEEIDRLVTFTKEVNGKK